MALSSDALGAIDKAWLDARESSIIDPGIMDRLNSIGQKYGERIINNIISANMILIDGFHKDFPTKKILEIINIFNDNHNMKIDIPHAVENF